MIIRQKVCYKLLYLLFIITGILSCSKRVLEQDIPKESDLQLEFTTFVDKVKSNSLVSSSADLQAYPISIIANASIDGTNYSVFNNDRLYYADQIWNYDVIRYWIPGAKYLFTAFAPYVQISGSGSEYTLSNGEASLSIADGIPTLTITDYNTGKFTSGGTVYDARTEDLLAAHYIRDNTDSKDYSAVPLNLEHLLSCVSFSIRNTTNDDVVRVTDISLAGLMVKSDITINTSSVIITPKDEAGSISSSDRTPSAGATAFLPKGMSEDDFKPLFDCEILTLLPQTLYKQNIILSFTAHKTSGSSEYSFNLGNVESLREWKAGKKYNYSISITSTDILFQVAEVSWIEHDVEL